MDELRMQEIKTRWYKDPTQLTSSANIAGQAFVDIHMLLHYIESLHSQHDQIEKETIAISRALRSQIQQAEQERDEAFAANTTMREELEAMREYVAWHAANGSKDAITLLSRYIALLPDVPRYPKEGETK